MSAAPVPAALRREQLLSRWLLLLAVIYLLSSLVWFSATPLGRIPVVDSKQQVALAQLMAQGQTPAEPFHRAPLHPFLLSLGFRCGLGSFGVFLWARVINLASIILAAWAASRLVELWRGGLLARRVAAALVLLNPVLIFFAGGAFDILPAMAVGAWGFVFALRYLQALRHEPEETLSWRWALGAGLCFALAAQFRSHFLPLALAWPVLVWWRHQRDAFRNAWLALAPVLASLCLFSLANHHVGGSWSPMPWQGPYNLYVGNGPAANGRYFVQSMDVGGIPDHENPAKVESQRLYEQRTGHQPGSYSIAELNDYWTRETLAAIRARPLRWCVLMTMKAYSFLNDAEQYDNLTYSVHKANSPWLRWNPLGWGLLLALAAGAWVRRRPPGGGPLLVLVLVYAGGVILFFCNDRFRVPLLPLLSAGVALWLVPVGGRERTGARAAARSRLSSPAGGRLLSGLALEKLPGLWRPLLVTGLVGLLCFSRVAGVDEEPSRIQDYRTLAYASLRVGYNDEAEQWALRGLALQPGDVPCRQALDWVRAARAAAQPDS